MAVIINEQEIDVDIEEELEPYLEEHFYRHQTRGIKLQSCSPFRDEKTPSFAVNLENGTWIDSGATDDAWSKGNFIKLLSYLMAVTYEESEQFLWEKYRTIYSDVDNLVLNIEWAVEEKPKRIISKDELKPFMYRNPYLTKRGISEKVQRAFKIGYDRENHAVLIPWMDKNENLINFKFRSVKDKRFWYLSDGQPIKQHIYGMHFVFKMNLKTVFVVESETDALYLWTHGIPAIALGSASLSKAQEKILINSPIESLVLAFDADKAGYRCKKDCIKRLQGVLELWEMPMPYGCKDINDIHSSKVVEATGKARVITPTFL
ncbi:toprim domain-containing protein [Priestia aryabhattai]|uniref:toprim domain-containing protein n=1 Tax=Priestia aryabhattai TaxID=412384 RepID=UPI00203EC13A|nr:toprim domain-containing protein [Priestia aryabhattai]MCM3639683.1 toprim domain-containing protein [Priestia aryabhattai]